MEKLNGPFKDIIPNFVKYKKSLGYKYDNTTEFVKLDRILSKANIKDLDYKKIYELLITNEGDFKQKQKNYSCLKKLYQFMRVLGYEDIYFEEMLFKKSNKFKAKILTKKELNVFFKVLDEMCFQNKNYTLFQVLFRLVYSCGLRINEALNLKISDYSREGKTIYIRKSKENVDRLLPLSDSMYLILEQYMSYISHVNQTYVFEIKDRQLPYYHVSKVFEQIKKELDFNFRIHDLRHTFAVSNFNRLIDKGYNESWILYYLHIYLGHQRITSTEYYLQLTSTRFKKAIRKLDSYYSNLFPRVGDKDE